MHLFSKSLRYLLFFTVLFCPLAANGQKNYDDFRKGYYPLVYDYDSGYEDIWNVSLAITSVDVTASGNLEICFAYQPSDKFKNGEVAIDVPKMKTRRSMRVQLFLDGREPGEVWGEELTFNVPISEVKYYSDEFTSFLTIFGKLCSDKYTTRRESGRKMIERIGSTRYLAKRLSESDIVKICIDEDNDGDSFNPRTDIGSAEDFYSLFFFDYPELLEDPKQTSSTSSASASKSSSTSAASYLKVDGSTTSKTVSFSSSGGRQYYSVDTSASDFETWGVPTWCSVEKSSTGFTLVCASNPSSSSRSDYMKVKADGQEIRIDISQSGSTSSYSSSSSRPSSSSRYSYGGRRTRSYSKPWITIGIDGSLDYFISDSQTQTTYYDPYYGDYYTEYTEGEDKLAFGAGLRVRIGRIDQWFNLIGGARYMFGGMKGIQVPVLLNWNLLRGDEMAMYIGGGYEFGITEMYKGLGSAMVQLGISIPHFDCSFFYKPSQSVLGLGMTVYL